MLLEEILGGESKNIEFKESRPRDSIKYVKSVVAFANGTGGKLVFGVDDKTRKVIGIEDSEVFVEMDAIANAIADTCSPVIIPDIYVQTVDNKNVIVVDVSVGMQRPYYIKTLGVDAGTYIRIAGTSRPADEYMVQELRIEGSRRSFDELPCIGLKITDEDIEKLCHNMMEQAEKNSAYIKNAQAIRKVGIEQLLSWGILLEKDDKLLPTNAYAVLVGSDRISNTIQCAVFKGETKAFFIDKREYVGPVWEIIEEAFQYVLRNIMLGARIKGLYRNDIYEIAPDAIRELIINAVVHRSYLDPNNIQVAIYDNRLEITSPGKLPMNQTLERMQKGNSKVRNRALAKAFAYMRLVESWGSGLPRVIREVEEFGYKKPEFLDGELDVRINIYRDREKFEEILTRAPSVDELLSGTENGGLNANKPSNDPENGGLNANKPSNDPKDGGLNADKPSSGTEDGGLNTKKFITEYNWMKEDLFAREELDILTFMNSDPSITLRELSEIMDIPLRRIERLVKRFRELGVLVREGSKKSGKWVVVDKS